jgi:hypothetical protein
MALYRAEATNHQASLATERTVSSKGSLTEIAQPVPELPVVDVERAQQDLPWKLSYGHLDRLRSEPRRRKRRPR